MHRGFIGGIELEAADWLAHGDAILREHPVQEVRLTTLPDIDETADCIRDCFPDGFDGEVSDEDLLRKRWPTVKTWHLPTDFDPRTAPMMSTEFLRRMREDRGAPIIPRSIFIGTQGL